MSSQEHYYLGIDGGGSKCKALIQDAQGNLLGEGLAGPANPVRGIDTTQHAIIDATEQALCAAGLTPEDIGQLHAGIGLAGVNLPSFRVKMQQWQHPFKTMQMTTDLHIACLGAHDGNDGAVIITGTGSSAAAVVNGQYYEIGGHGFAVGDKGSGAWLGATAVAQSLEALDKLRADAPIVALLLQQLEADNAHQLVENLLHATPAKYARLAPLVLAQAQQQDPLALAIVLDGADYLSRVARQLLRYQPPRLSMIGGLATIWADWLDADVQCHLNTPIHAPETGALLLARQSQ